MNKAPKSRDFRGIKKKYLSFIQHEFGGITLEGLPADQALGSSQFKLEALYVPLHLVDTLPSRAKDPEMSADADEVSSDMHQSISRRTSGLSVASVIYTTFTSRHTRIARIRTPDKVQK